MTQLSIANLLAALPDNNRRLISPGDIRSIVDTLRPDYATIYLSATAATVVATASTYLKCAGTTTLGLSRNFTMPASNRLRCNASVTRFVQVTAHFGIDAASLNQELRFMLVKNGTLDTTAAQPRYFEPIADIGPYTIHGQFVLAPGDYIELWGANFTSASNFTVLNMVMTALGFAY